MTAFSGNKGFTYGRFGLALVGLGMGLHLISGTLNQAALARGRAMWAAGGDGAKRAGSQHYLGGKLCPPAGGTDLDENEPATAERIAEIPDSDERDSDAAARAARSAFPSWARTSIADRSRLLLRLADLIEQNAEELAQLESRDSGKAISLARTLDIPRAVANFRFFGTAILHFSSEAHITDGNALNYTLRQPIGVAGLISPWNLPLYLLSWKIAPAIAAGNTCIAKPSELTPLTAKRLAAMSIETDNHVGVNKQAHGSGQEPRLVDQWHGRVE